MEERMGTWCFRLCPNWVLHVHHYLSKNICKVPTMCILKGVGNRGGVRAFLLSAFQCLHQVCSWCCGVPPKAPCRIKSLTPQVVRNVGSWWLSNPSLGGVLLPSKGAASLKVICLLQGQPISHNWSMSKVKGTASLPSFRPTLKGHSSSRVPCRICWDLSHNYYALTQPSPLPNPVSLIDPLQEFLRAQPPMPPLLHDRLSVCKSLSPEMGLRSCFCLAEDDGWMQGDSSGHSMLAWVRFNAAGLVPSSLPFLQELYTSDSVYLLNYMMSSE